MVDKTEANLARHWREVVAALGASLVSPRCAGVPNTRIDEHHSGGDCVNDVRGQARSFSVEPLSRRFGTFWYPARMISKRGRGPYHGFDAREHPPKLWPTSSQRRGLPFSTRADWRDGGWAAKEPEWPAPSLA